MKTKTIVVKMPGQVAYESLCEETGSRISWADVTAQEAWERFAEKHNFQPLTEEVPDKPTNGELFQKAILSTRCNEDAAAMFLRLLRERDGEPVKDEPLAVTEQWLLDNWCDSSHLKEFAEKINAHRGVRKKVTAEMMVKADFKWRESKGDANERYAAAADYINAKLSKAVERKDGAK